VKDEKKEKKQTKTFDKGTGGFVKGFAKSFNLRIQNRFVGSGLCGEELKALFPGQSSVAAFAD
jgi:hypothetical protein